MKKSLAMLIVLTLLLSVSGFTLRGSAGGAEPALPEGPVEIELWSDWNTGADVLANAAARFEEEYSDYGYKVKVNQFSGSERTALISAAIETDTLPALFLSAWFTTADYVHQGLVADITDVAAPLEDDMFTNAYESTIIDGKSYMVGLYQSYFGLLYNADILREAGLEDYVTEDPYEVATWTMDDMENVILPTLAEYVKGTEKCPICFFTASEQGDTGMLNYLKMMGGDIWEDGYNVAGDDEKTVAALEKMVTWYNNGWTNNNVVTKDGSEVSAEFKNQVIVISTGQYTNYTSALADMESGAIDEFDVRIAAVPVDNDGAAGATMANYVYGACVMNNGHEDQMAVAKEFIRWISTDEETLMAINAGTIPTFHSINEKIAPEKPIYAGLAKMESNIWDFTGGAAGYVSTRSLLYPELQNAFGGSKTPAQALADYEAAANEVVQEYMDNSVVLN